MSVVETQLKARVPAEETAAIGNDSQRRLTWRKFRDHKVAFWSGIFLWAQCWRRRRGFLPPGVMVIVTVLALNFLCDGLRDAADPYTSRTNAFRRSTCRSRRGR